MTGCMGMNYSESGAWGLGFSETQLAPEIYRVTYNGYNIPAAKATDFALLRSAELCQKAGFTHFVVTDQNGQTTAAGGILMPGGNSAIYANVNKPEISLTVQFSGERPGAYAAAFVQGSLKKKYGIK